MAFPSWMFTANLNCSLWHHLANLCCVVDLKSSHGLLPNPVASCCFRFCCIILRSSGMMRHCHDACHSSVLKNYATLLVCRFQCDRSVSPHGWHVSRTWRRGMPHSIAMRLSWILKSLYNYSPRYTHWCSSSGKIGYLTWQGLWQWCNILDAIYFRVLWSIFHFSTWSVRLRLTLELSWTSNHQAPSEIFKGNSIFLWYRPLTFKVPQVS